MCRSCVGSAPTDNGQNCDGICMQYEWNICGKLAHVWNMYGICMECAWNMLSCNTLAVKKCSESVHNKALAHSNPDNLLMTSMINDGLSHNAVRTALPLSN